MEFFYYLCGLAAFVLFILFMDEKRKKKEIEEQLEQLKTTIQILRSKHESEFDEYEKKFLALKLEYEEKIIAMHNFYNKR